MQVRTFDLYICDRKQVGTERRNCGGWFLPSDANSKKIFNPVGRKTAPQNQHKKEARSESNASALATDGFLFFFSIRWYGSVPPKKNKLDATACLITF